MKKVAIVSAMEEETSYIQQYLENRSGWEEIEKNIYQNKAIGTKVYVKVLGIGKVNAAFQTADVIHELHPDLIVNIGVSGGLSKKVRRGTIAIGKNYVQTDMRPFLKANYPKINDTPDEIVEGLERVSKENGFDYIVGKLATGDFFLNDSKERERIIEEFNPVSFDMETAAIAQVATSKKINFAAIRIFSDLADESALEIFQNIEKDESEIRDQLNTRPTQLIIQYLEQSYCVNNK